MEKLRSIKNKKGGSAGILFIIVIILLVILAGVWGVKKYLKNRPDVLIEEFPGKLQDDVNKLVNVSRDWRQVDYNLPENFTRVCFMDKERDNLVLKSDSSSIMEQIKNVDLSNTTKEKQEFCVNVTEGEVEMVLRKEENNPKVIIEKAE